MDSPRLMEPLLPTGSDWDRLVGKAEQVVTRADLLAGWGAAETVAAIAELTRSMNSYYSNRIEGQGTHPLNVERALRSEYSTTPEIARLQHLARKHIDAEAQLLESMRGPHALKASSLLEMHSTLFAGDSSAPTGIRRSDVVVGRHVPPVASIVSECLHRCESVYAAPRPAAEFLVAVAAAHHRLLWVHPFEDGNGRAVRMQTSLALHPITRGLWSTTRALARSRDHYYQLLDRADEPRRGDLDGRGSRSASGLVEWCDWFIDCASDQVTFMADLLRLDTIRTRIDALVNVWSHTKPGIRAELALPLHHVFVAGRTTRRDVLTLTGLEERTARAAISAAIHHGLLYATSHRSPVEFRFPVEALAILLPGLYPEAAAPIDLQF
jgi:Fic family protein